MKILLLICSLLLLTACTQNIQTSTHTSPADTGFCGTSTSDACTSDTDCITGGCSGQVCQSSSTEASATTCEYQECYNAEAYGLSCACHDKKCSWQ